MLFFLSASSSPADSAAQVLAGSVLEEGRDTPVAGAMISLVDRDGERRARTTSDSLGRFRLAPPEDGEYMVEASRLGYARTLSPLFSLTMAGTVPFDILMTPSPIGLEGFEVSVEREADELLRNFGLTPAMLGQRWIGREDLEDMPLPVGPREAIRWRGIPGVWVEPGIDSLCVTFRRGRTGIGRRRCALVLLNGVSIPRELAQALNPLDLQGIAILTPVDATTFYGGDAGGGAVLMWTRSGRR